MTPICDKLVRMDPVLFTTICIMILIIAVTAGLWARSRSARPVVGGIGALLVPLGLFLLGLMQLIYNGAISIIDWVSRTVWNDVMSWGAGLAGTGVVLLVIAGFMKHRVRPKAPKAPKAQQVAPSSPGSRQLTPTKPGTPTTRKKTMSEADPEDAEIEAILRKRGIM